MSEQEQTEDIGGKDVRFGLGIMAVLVLLVVIVTVVS